METQSLDIKTVAIVGAGVSGVAAAVHLKRAGLDITVFERNARAGGIWVYDPRISKDAAYPSLLPSTGDSPEYVNVAKRFKSGARHDSPMRDDDSDTLKPDLVDDDLERSFAPPGPCYIALKNNVSTIEMEMTFQPWKDGTAEFVPHHVLADYLQDGARSTGVLDSMSFNTRVNRIQKADNSWEVSTAQLVQDGSELSVVDKVQHFDAVVIASGHYHAPNVAELPGLARWKEQFPGSVWHSKRYRRPEQFKDQNILIIGAGVSSLDIARDLGGIARSVYQSSRDGPYDIPSHLLPDNGARIGAIKSFDLPESTELNADGSIPGNITLQSGTQLCGIHHVIVATGYHVSFPFMREYHADGVAPEDADENVLVTNGQQTHNLHKDIWYVQDPTLAFVGVPYHVATFTLFEFQAMALAAVYGGHTTLPTREAMRKEYEVRLKEKGAGRFFHSLKKKGDEIAYVDDLVKLVNECSALPTVRMKGHSDRWHEAYIRRGERMKLLFGKVRDPALDAKVLDLMEGC